MQVEQTGLHHLFSAARTAESEGGEEAAAAGHGRCRHTERRRSKAASAVGRAAAEGGAIRPRDGRGKVEGRQGKGRGKAGRGQGKAVNRSGIGQGKAVEKVWGSPRRGMVCVWV